MAQQPAKWEHLYVEDGIAMYVALDAPLPTYKAEGTIPVGLLELLAVIADVPRRPEWLPDILESRILEGGIESSVVIYERFRMPGPIANRDCVVRSVIEKDYARGVVTVTFEQVEHHDMPPNDEHIRMPVVRGLMRYRFIDAHRTAAYYQTTLDVGGSLPRWLVRLATKRVPIFTLQSLIEQIGKTRGRYDDFIRAQRAKLEFNYEKP